MAQYNSIKEWLGDNNRGELVKELFAKGEIDSSTKLLELLQSMIKESGCEIEENLNIFWAMNYYTELALEASVEDI